MPHVLNSGLTEIRFLGKTTYAIYTKDRALIAEACAHDLVQGLGAYQLLNPLKDDTPERRNAPRDVLFQAQRGQLSKDEDIKRLESLLLDSDVRKPTGAAATADQRQAACDHSDKLEAALIAEGWPASFAADSGNGFHRIPRIDLPNDSESHFLLSNFLHLMARKFDTPEVKLDKSVSNAGRITRLYGTRNMKAGRDSEVVSLGSLVVVTAEQIRSVVKKWRGELGYKLPAVARPGSWTPERMERFLTFYNIDFRPPIQAVGDGLLWVLTPCPLNEAHTGSSPAVYLSKMGWPKFRCMHDSCGNIKWSEFRRRLHLQTGRWFLYV